MGNNSKSLASKFALGAVVLVGLLVAGWFFTRPVAKVVIISGGRAINAVPGSVVVRADRDEQLKAEVSGVILSTSLEDGKSFKKGEILAEFDPADLLLDIERIEAELKAAKKRNEVDKTMELALETAQGELENAARVLKQGMLSDFDYQKKEREFKQAQQKLELSKLESQKSIDTLDNQLRTKKRQLEKMTVRAPFDGVVSRVLAKENALVSAGEPLANLISITRTVEAKVSEENFAGVRTGQKAVVRFLGYPGTFEAVVTKLLPTADPETQRYLVHMDVAIEAARLVPGITGEVNIVVGERDTNTLVPRRALFGHSVWVVTDGKVEARPVQLGFISLNLVEVTANLSPGEQVIIDDIDQYHQGQRVRVAVREPKK